MASAHSGPSTIRDLTGLPDSIVILHATYYIGRPMFERASCLFPPAPSGAMPSIQGYGNQVAVRYRHALDAPDALCPVHPPSPSSRLCAIPVVCSTRGRGFIVKLLLFSCSRSLLPLLSHSSLPFSATRFTRSSLPITYSLLFIIPPTDTTESIAEFSTNCQLITW